MPEQVTFNYQNLMKKLILLSALLVMSLIAKPQSTFSLTEGESAIVYSLPKMEFYIEVETEKVVQKPGMFYRYSERYLATDKVITEEKTSFRLKSIKVKVHAVPDAARTYSFVPNSALQSSRLSVNSQGILCGVNVNCEPEVIAPQTVSLPAKDNSTQNALLPLGEEYMMAGSEAKLAEGAAKQIYRIRESRLGLLTADTDKLPADGESFKSMLEGLNTMERELTELFVGKTTTELQTKTLILNPAAGSANEVLFRLSALKGMVPSDDLGGAPYYISIVPTTIPTSTSKSKSEKEALYYIIPAETQISIGDGINTLYSNTFFVPQFGKTVPLTEGLLKQPHIEVHIDSLTGRLLSIE